MATSKEDLKEYFSDGEKPSGDQFGELIDAFTHVNQTLGGGGTLAEVSAAEAGVVQDKYMSPYLVFQAIKALTRLSILAELSGEVDDKIQAKIDALVDGADGTMDTLGEIATLLTSDTSGLDGLLAAINLRYKKTQLDAFFEGTFKGKKQVGWDNVTGKPAGGFAAENHSHAISDLTGVTGKSDDEDNNSTELLATSRAVRKVDDKIEKEIEKVDDMLDDKAARNHEHAISDLSDASGKSASIGLNDDNYLATSKAVKKVNDKVNGKAETIHSHSVAGLSDVRGKSDDIDLDNSNWLATSLAVKLLGDKVNGKAATVHEHAISDLTGITGKSPRVDLNDDNYLATSKAVKLVNDRTLNYVKAKGVIRVPHVFGNAGETINHIQIHYTAEGDASSHKFVLSSSYPSLEASFMALISKVTLLVYDPTNATTGTRAYFRVMLKIKSTSSGTGTTVPSTIRIHWEVI